MGSGISGLYSGAYVSVQKAVAGELIFSSKEYEYFYNISRRCDIDPNGVFDVVGHGSPLKMQIEINGTTEQYDARSIAQLIIRNKGYRKKQPVRLLSCWTGAKADGFAQNLANKLNAIVYAPENLVWAYSNGYHIIAPRDPQHPDQPHPTIRSNFVAFYPGGNKNER